MADQITEPKNIGLGKENKIWLEKLQAEKFFKEMKDGYIFSISYALSKGIDPPEIQDKDGSIYSISTIDPDREIYSAISCLMPLYNGSIYKMAEKLADYGCSELVKLYRENKLDIAAIVEQSQ